MELAIPSQKRYTLAECFRMAEASPTKLEYRAGEIIDMAGATLDHNQIAANLIRQLGNRLDGGPCRALGATNVCWQRTTVTPTRCHRFPRRACL